MIGVGDMVIQRWAKIRGPSGEAKQLEEAPYYGIVIAADVDMPRYDKEIVGMVHRVLWFDKEGVRREEQHVTIELDKDLEKISG